MSIVRVRIHVGEVLRSVDAIRRKWDAIGEDVLNFAETEGLKILKEEVPKGKTYQLLESCEATRTGKTVEVYPTAPYAPIIDGTGRTKASPGRYVPAIDRRLVTAKLSPHHAVMKSAHRRRLQGRLPKGMKIVFDPDEPRPNKQGIATLGYFRGRVVDPKTGKTKAHPMIKVYTGARTKRDVEETYTHELWHAVQYAEGLPLDETEAQRVEKALYVDIGIHPGATRTPFGEKTAARLAESLEEFIRQRVREIE